MVQRHIVLQARFYGITLPRVVLGDAVLDAVQQLIKQGQLQSGEVLGPVLVSLPKTLYQVVVARVPQPLSV